MAKILSPTLANLRRLAGVLARGGLVAVPTETVYGLAADALNVRACRSIFRVKGRPTNDPLIVHVPSLAAAEKIAEIPVAARRLARAFWPGPLTLVLRKRACVPDLVTSGRPTVAVRNPAHPVMRRLLRLCGRPLAAPSANPFGYISPTTAEHVQHGLGRRLEFILDGGPCRVGVESTIVDLSIPGRPRILRVGGLDARAISRVLQCEVEVANRPKRGRQAQLAPGMLSRHYSPRTPLRLHAKLPAALVRRGGADEGFLFFAPPRGGKPIAQAGPVVAILSPRGSLTAAARHLFARLHALDQMGLRQIHAELAPERGAGVAINDRLRRAAAQRPGRAKNQPAGRSARR